MSARGLNRDGFAALLPVRDGQEESMREALRALPEGGQSPFARLAGTHFARLTLVAPLLDRDERELPGVPFCLFFAAEFDAFAGGYLEGLCRSLGEQAGQMFGRCVGYPGSGAPGAFAAWMLEHRVPAGFSIHGYPGVPAAEVQESLELRERIIAFAVETRGLDPAALRQRWGREGWEGGV